VEANLKSRVITAAIAIPLLLLIIGWGPSWLFSSVFLLLGVVALDEFFGLVAPGRVTERITGIVFGLGLWLLLVFAEPPAREIGASLLLTLCFSIFLFLSGGAAERLTRLGWTLVGGFYLGYLLPHWVLLFWMPNGRSWVFLLLLVIMVGDSAAYFVGRRFGARKLAPQLSPGKTVEGALAYVAGSMGAGITAGMFLMPEFAAGEILLLALAASILGQVGDLFESWIKRAFSVKDSGHWLPGHGGLLDRLDSLIFPVVFTTAYLRVFHP
jgi:phosphatidate cytidylyltransferase